MDPDPGGQKTCGSGVSGSGFGSATLVLRVKLCERQTWWDGQKCWWCARRGCRCWRVACSWSSSATPARSPGQTRTGTTCPQIVQWRIWHVSFILFWAVLWIRIRMFLSLPDPDPLVRGTDPTPELDPDPDPIVNQNVTDPQQWFWGSEKATIAPGTLTHGGKVFWSLRLNSFPGLGKKLPFPKGPGGKKRLRHPGKEREDFYFIT